MTESIDAYLVAGGRYHDIDFARMELLKLLSEHAHVRTRVGSKGEVVLEVEDDGPGIPAEVRERIFEVFYSSRGGGTGLGLPIARQIVERHGGTVQVDSVEGQGTTFRIRLPRHQPKSSVSAEESS